MRKPFSLFAVLILLFFCAACAADSRESVYTPAEEARAGETAGFAEYASDPATPVTAAPGNNEPSASPAPGFSAESETDRQPREPEKESDVSPPPQSAPQADQESEILNEPDDPIILYICGDGVFEESSLSLSGLKTLHEGYREYDYSYTNNWPSRGYISARGVSLPVLLRFAGLKEGGATAFKLSSTDGYYFIVTYEQVFGSLYSYSDHGPDGSGGAFTVEPIIAWEWGEAGRIMPENICSCFGQSGPSEVNTTAFVRNLCRIEALTAPSGVWPAPDASVSDGETVPAGAEFRLLHDNMDSVRIYYTTDGSEPDYYSSVYNPSASFMQPRLTEPLILTQSVTVKAFAAALGKERSPVAVFAISVDPA